MCCQWEAGQEGQFHAWHSSSCMCYYTSLELRALCSAALGTGSPAAALCTARHGHGVVWCGG
jgi:hypothetical protein